MPIIMNPYNSEIQHVPQILQRPTCGIIQVMPLDAADKTTLDSLANRFSYHAPTGDQPARYERLRAEARGLATLIVTLCPSSAERNTALTRLQETVMWANAAIACNTPGATE